MQPDKDKLGSAIFRAVVKSPHACNKRRHERMWLRLQKTQFCFASKTNSVCSFSVFCFVKINVAFVRPVTHSCEVCKLKRYNVTY